MAKSVSAPSVEELAKALKDARERGQQVVPIIGAGLSADCGFPVITAVVRYFGMLYSYIQKRGPSYYYNKRNNPIAAIFDDRFTLYKAAPLKFLEDFGWPDLFRLNEDLLTKLKDGNKGQVVKDGNDHAVREALDSLLPQFNQTGLYQYDGLHKGISSALTDLENDKLFKNSELRTAIGEARDKINSRFEMNGPKSARFDVIGDWRRLILYFTNYRSDYADALFARFGATRKPGQGHRFLTFLSKVLAIRTILTFNFDSLIEEALELEGIRAKVFAMERGAGLPHQNLLRDQLSVIKAHGSTHALLLDEQLDRPLSKEYLDRFDRITGDNPVLLVMGCSAEDRRLRDLVSHVLEHGQDFSVAWLHYEQWRPSFLEKKPKELTDKALILPTNNPGATLLHLYSWLTGSNPASRVPYLSHVQQPIELAVYKGDGNDGTASETTERQFVWIAVTGRKFLTSSQILLRRANEWARKGYQFIWIDLESLHTFAGVIGSIIDQCRKFDPDLAPSLLPVDVDKIETNVSGKAAFSEKALKPALERVLRALRRARYYLAIDGLGTYAWPATTHHGLTHRTTTIEVQRRVDRMVDFLEKLEKEDLGESRIGVGLDRLGARYRGMKLPNPACFKRLFEKATEQREEEKQQGKAAEDNRSFRFDDHFSLLRSDLRLFSLKRIPRKLKEILSSGPTAPTGSAEQPTLRNRARIATMLFSLACFRRTRPLVATNRLLEPLLGEALVRDRLQEILKVFTESGRIGILQQLEGGSYWFNHSIRDQIYEKNTDCTDTASIRKCLRVRARSRMNRQHRRNAVFQLFLGAITHQRISQIWYNDTFVQSRDTFAFLEYTYHRISSIRNLVKLRALARVGANDKIAGHKVIAEDLVRGITKCSELICLLDEKDPPFKQLGFGDDGPFADVLRNYSKDNSVNRDWRSEAEQIEKSLQLRHRRQLHGLYRGWTRAEVTLRTQLPAEQLLHWCDELLSDDLVQRCNRLVIKYRKRGEWNFEPEYYRFVDNNPEEPDLIDPELDHDNGDLKEFRRFLQDLQVKLWIERSDYESCITHRRRHLWHSLGEKKQGELTKKDQTLTQIKEKGPISEEIECSQDLINQCGIRQCHQLLNIANGKLKLQQEITCDEKGLRAEANKVLVLLNNVKKQLKKLAKTIPPRPSPETNEHDEALLRLFHLQTEAQLAHVSMFSHDGFTGNQQSWKPGATNVVAARKTITKALEEIGGRDVHTRAAPRSVILHPTTDAALYLQYRSLFNMFNGRIEWLRGPENIENGLKRALRSFELARGGLDNDSTLLSALIEIYWTEALLARGRFVLFDIKSEDGFHKAQESYDSARGAMRRARESLLVSHRYLMWRKLFFRIATQYHADRLLLRYAQLQDRALEISTSSKKQGVPEQRPKNALTISIPANDKQYFEESAREALLRLRRAYQTLVSALDLYLPLSAKNDTESSAYSKRFRWLYRMWWELTLCGYASGRVVIAALRGKPIDDYDPQAHHYVIQQLRWLNKADGVDDSALEEVFAKNHRLLKHQYELSLAGAVVDNPLKTALTRRLNIIKQSNALSEDWAG